MIRKLQQEVEILMARIVELSLSEAEIGELAIEYRRAIGIRDRFIGLRYSGVGLTIEEVEDLGLRITESILVLKMMIKEQEGKDMTGDVKKLRDLYRKFEERKNNMGITNGRL